ncbi:MAG: hypothetical protein IJ039_04700 [Clostridia bacterium]|nr:hypothetical protein [Clostridia bacterium]
MGEELDRMMRLRKWSIVFLVLFIVAVIAIIGVVIFMNTGDYAGTNRSFNKITAQNDIQTKAVNVDAFSKLYFFSQSYENKRTLFTNAIPDLKIVDSKEYKIEFTSNGDILSKLDIVSKDDALYIDFNEEYYNNISRMGKSYKGLYVDCAELSVTVYAPVCYLVSDAELNLDFETPDVKTLIVIVNGEIRQGRIYGVSSDAIGIFVSGNSSASVSGESREYTELLVKHNSNLDVSGLKTPVVSETVSSQIFGISYVKHADRVKYSIDSVGFVLSVAMVLGAMLLLAGFIVFQILFLKQKKEIDQFIDEVEKEGNFLQNP